MEQTVIDQQCIALHQDVKQCQMKASQCSTWRFLLVIAILFLLYQATPIAYGAAVIALFVFLWIAKRHRHIKQQLEEKQTMIEVYQDILARKDHGWKSFEDQGNEFMKEEMTQAYDLDLFGKASLFQYLSIAKTVFGKETLASWLSVMQNEPVTIQHRQEAVKECIEKEDMTLRFVTITKLYGKHSRKLKKKKLFDFLAFMEEQQEKQPFWITIISFVLPCIVIASFLLVALNQLSVSIAMAAFTVTLAVAFLMFIKNSSSLNDIESMSELMKDYQAMFEGIQNATYESTWLKQQQLALQDALSAIRKLNQILAFVKVRSNSILFLFANGFALLDLHCVRALTNWKHTYGTQIKGWLHAVGNIEAISSLAQLGFAKDHLCFGEQKDAMNIEMLDVQHPLLKEQEAIANSLTMHAGSYVITGSNMSGKTTFLRTIGVNMVLFMAGAPVCAKQFHASPLSIYTSMRVHDDVSEGISTFYAEILRIKQMMDAAKTNQPMLVLIDEIFKGTNSADRILCAKEAIIKLHLPHVICMVSTHDFELCDLDQDEQIQAKNYHFSEYYEGERICFDYMLKTGRCTTTNARQLMKLAGF